jgi:tellurite resistance protein TehA-like permease
MGAFAPPYDAQRISGLGKGRTWTSPRGSTTKRPLPEWGDRVTEHRPTRPSIKDTIRHFNPAWFAAVMGTGVVPLAISFLDGDWVEYVAAVFVVLSVILFLVILVPWTLRFFLYAEAVRHDLHHPIAASFFPTMPTAIVVIALDLLKYPDLLFSAPTSEAIASWMWLIGALGI